MTQVAVVMTTYAPEGEVGRARMDYAWESLHSLLTNMRGSGSSSDVRGGDIGFRLQIADDGSADSGYLRDLLYLVQSASNWSDKSTFKSLVQRRGIGASLNSALEEVQEQIWMYTTDDWLLTNRLDVSGAVALIEQLGYDYVRLGPIHPHLMCSTEFHQEIGWWLRLYQQHGGFAFATRPFLMTKRMYERVGPFIENADSYETEREYADRVGKIEELKLASITIHGDWKHIGIVEVGKLPVPVPVPVVVPHV